MYIHFHDKILTSIAIVFNSNDVQKSLKGIFKCYNLLNVGIALYQVIQQQQTL
jgi:hypothetical protein